MAKVIIDYSIHGDGRIEMDYDPDKDFSWEEIHEAILNNCDDIDIHLTYPEEEEKVRSDIYDRII